MVADQVEQIMAVRICGLPEDDFCHETQRYNRTAR
jgi:hypothetical protein